MVLDYDLLNKYVIQSFPFPGTSAANFHGSIPLQIREDFAEARKCWSGESHKGVVVFCRRAVQSMVEDKGAKGRDLRDKIEDLRTKYLLTDSVARAAHEVRYFGNFGAHPQDDGLDDITNDDARIIWGLAQSMAADLYVRPFETAQLTQKRVDAGRRP